MNPLYPLFVLQKGRDQFLNTNKSNSSKTMKNSNLPDIHHLLIVNSLRIAKAFADTCLKKTIC